MQESFQAVFRLHHWICLCTWTLLRLAELSPSAFGHGVPEGRGAFLRDCTKETLKRTFSTQFVRTWPGAGRKALTRKREVPHGGAASVSCDPTAPSTAPNGSLRSLWGDHTGLAREPSCGSWPLLTLKRRQTPGHRRTTVGMYGTTRFYKECPWRQKHYALFVA